MQRPFTLNDDGEVSYTRVPRTLSRRVEGMTLPQTMISVPGYALENLALVLFQQGTRWLGIYEYSRLLHPAEFVEGEDVVIPGSA